MDGKRIEVIEDFPVSDLRLGVFGNPRKIRKKKADELLESLNQLGDFGVILIDENNNVIAGNQRVSLLKEHYPDTTVLVKKLIGYSNAELKAINIKDNTHAGEWDLDILADWTADLQIDLGIESNSNERDEMSIKKMELILSEKYDYVIIACRNEIDYQSLCIALGIDGAKTIIPNAKGRTIKCRAVWYDEMKAQILRKK